MNEPSLDVIKMEELQRKVKEYKDYNKKYGGGENRQKEGEVRELKNISKKVFNSLLSLMNKVRPKVWER